MHYIRNIYKYTQPLFYALVVFLKKVSVVYTGINKKIYSRKEKKFLSKWKQNQPKSVELKIRGRKLRSVSW